MALVQNALCLINTLMIQRVLTPIIYARVNPYGVFRLDMDERLALDELEVAG